MVFAVRPEFTKDLPMFPEELWTGMRTAMPPEKLLIDVLRGMCTPPIKPLDVSLFPAVYQRIDLT